MRIRLLGTGDANGTPAPFCDCPVCATARRDGGREVRTKSGALVDGILKIDHSTDTMRHVLTQGLDMTKVHHLLITHAHQDHFAPDEIALRNGVFAALPDAEPKLSVYGGPDVCETMRAVAEEAAPNRIEVIEARPYESFDAIGYRVTPVPSDHMEGKCLNYLVEKDVQSLFYGLDMGYLPDEATAFLAGRGIDLFVLDCTFGLMDVHYPGHMTLSDCRVLRDALKKSGAARPDATFVLSHFAPISTYRALCGAAPDFVVAYDGIELSTEGGPAA